MTLAEDLEALESANKKLERQDSVRDLLKKPSLLEKFATKKSVIDKIASNLDINSEQARNVLIFHKEVRKHFNKILSTMNVANSVEMRKEGKLVKATKVAEIITEAIPFLGSILEPLASAARWGAESREESKKLKFFAAFEHVNDSFDPVIGASFAKEMASQTVAFKLEELKKCTSKEEVQKLAEDSSTMLLSDIVEHSEEISKVTQGHDVGNKEEQKELIHHIADETFNAGPKSSISEFSVFQLATNLDEMVH